MHNLPWGLGGLLSLSEIAFDTACINVHFFVLIVTFPGPGQSRDKEIQNLPEIRHGLPLISASTGPSLIEQMGQVVALP